MAEAYEIIEDGQTTGPHSLVVLRQKAEIFVLKPDALARPVGAAEEAATAPWRPIHEIPELRGIFPRRTLPKLSTPLSFDTANARMDAAIDETDVFTLLRDNAARQVAAEDRGPKPRLRRSRRRLWDALIVFTSLNGFAVLAGHWMGYHNPFVVAVFAMGNVGIFWVMFVVMDRY